MDDSRISYAAEYMTAVERTEALGLEALPRVLLTNDCVDMTRIMLVLLKHFDRHTPEELIGQTLAIYFALMPQLFDATRIRFRLTIGWMVRHGGARTFHAETGVLSAALHK
jgi:hypothetical protein